MTVVRWALIALVLTVAAPVWGKPKAVVHKIQRGDTLTSIARHYGTTVGSILRWNALKKNTMLTPGRRLGVPLPPGRSYHPRSVANSGKPSAKSSWKDFEKKPEAAGVLKLKSYVSEWSGRVYDSHGKLLPEAKAGIEGVFSSKRKLGQSHHIDPRLIELLVQVSDTFGGREILIVSGYRPGRRSRHASGDAMDFSIKGVPNWALRDYAKRFVNVGLGYYPNSHHVHLDVRERNAYWVDVSRPGQRARYIKPARRAHAKRSSRRRR